MGLENVNFEDAPQRVVAQRHVSQGDQSATVDSAASQSIALQQSKIVGDYSKYDRSISPADLDKIIRLHDLLLGSDTDVGNDVLKHGLHGLPVMRKAQVSSFSPRFLRHPQSIVFPQSPVQESARDFEYDDMLLLDEAQSYNETRARGSEDDDGRVYRRGKLPVEIARDYLTHAGPTDEPSQCVSRDLTATQSCDSSYPPGKGPCGKCGFVVTLSGHESRCGRQLRTKDWVKSAAWLGDVMLAMDVKSSILMSGAIDDSTYQSMVSNNRLSDMYDKLPPFLLVSPSFKATGSSVSNRGSFVEAAYAMSPSYRRRVIQELRLNMDGVLDQHVCTDALVSIIRDADALEPTQHVFGYCYLAAFTPKYRKWASETLKAFPTVRRLSTLIGTFPNRFIDDERWSLQHVSDKVLHLQRAEASGGATLGQLVKEAPCDARVGANPPTLVDYINMTNEERTIWLSNYLANRRRTDQGDDGHTVSAEPDSDDDVNSEFSDDDMFDKIVDVTSCLTAVCHTSWSDEVKRHARALSVPLTSSLSGWKVMTVRSAAEKFKSIPDGSKDFSDADMSKLLQECKAAINTASNMLLSMRTSYVATSTVFSFEKK